MKGQEILAGANDRIRKYRTANLKIEVTDKKGKPLTEAQVKVRQARHDFLFGCHYSLWQQNTDKQRENYWRYFKELHNYASLSFAWGRFVPERGKPRHDRMEEMLKLCEANNIDCQGHLVMWNHQCSCPTWLPDNPQEAIELCDEHVFEIISRYKGRFKYWILVNEATDCFREKSIDKTSYRNNLTRAWSYAGKVPFAKRFFPLAHKADPDAGMLINDYRVDKPYEKLIEQLVDEKGKPLYDVVGIQSHMHYRYWGVDKTWDICERFSRFGKPIHFTENTQISGRGRRAKNIRWRYQDPNWKTTIAGEKRQARIVAELYTLIFSHPAVEAFSWFNMQDYGWLGAPGGLLYAEDFTPKPAYEKLYELIKGEWWTEAEKETNAKGQCSVRSFYGDYTITVKRGSTKKTVKYHHTKGAKGPVKITL